MWTMMKGDPTGAVLGVVIACAAATASASPVGTSVGLGFKATVDGGVVENVLWRRYRYGHRNYDYRLHRRYYCYSYGCRRHRPGVWL